MGAVLDLVGVGSLGKGVCWEAGTQCYASAHPCNKLGSIGQQLQTPDF